MKKCYCSIWNLGPGRPFDNLYYLEKIDYFNDYIEVNLDGVKYIIYEPRVIKNDETHFVIKYASKVTWEQISNNKKSQNNYRNLEFIKDNHSIYCLENGNVLSKIKIRKTNAFEIYYDKDA